ncbi:MAG: hypothetical protein AAF674_05880 [Pseudomonadota bacterium]
MVANTRETLSVLIETMGDEILIHQHMHRANVLADQAPSLAIDSKP